MISESQKSILDPRTKLVLLLMISIFVLGGAGSNRMWLCNMILSAVPLILFAMIRKWRTCLGYMILYSTAYILQLMLLPTFTGLFGFLLLAITGILNRLLPGSMMGKYVISTTKVSEFIAAMERLHISDKFIIPLSVVFRFFPTIVEECSSINDAMRMRGIGLGGGKVLQMLEYRLIPMITCSVKIGEELSAAALTRGLGAPVKRTNVCEIGLHVLDYALLLVCFGICGFWIIGLVKG